MGLYVMYLQRTVSIKVLFSILYDNVITEPADSDHDPIPIGEVSVAVGDCNVTVSESARTADVSSRVKMSSYDRHSWLIRQKDGFMCSTCQQFPTSASAVWVTVPLPLKSGKKLYQKADKHAKSSVHLFCVEQVKAKQQSVNVQSQLVAAANSQTESETDAMKTLFRAAYFMFVQEIPHTTNWRSLVSTIAECESNKHLATYLRKCPANGHHLSQTSINEILESFGEAVAETVRQRLSSITDFSVMADECTDINGREIVSVCVRIIENHQVAEIFLGCWPIESTTAVVVTESIIKALRSHSLDPQGIVCAAFDGASNMSGQRGGVRALLAAYAPNLVFVHCRSHLLQLALVNSAANITEVKRTLALLNKLYSLFSKSPKRLLVLQATQLAVDGMAHKLVQPGETRWLSYDGSVDVVCKHYAAICLALEAIYADAGNFSCDAGGLLLQLRKSSTVCILRLLHSILQPLARLSKGLQSSEGNMCSAMESVKTVIEDLEEYDFDKLQTETEASRSKILEAGVQLDDDLSKEKCLKICNAFVKKIVNNLRQRFSDEVSQLCDLQKIFKDKSDSPDLSKVAKLLKVPAADLQSEWTYLRRLPIDLSLQQELIDLGTSAEKSALFPLFCRVARLLVLLPLGTATVERSFSTLNRILNSQRCRLNPEHVSQLMLLSVEGQPIPDVRDAKEEDTLNTNKLIGAAYSDWLKKPRRLPSVPHSLH